jgi:hypothetical protein
MVAAGVCMLFDVVGFAGPATHPEKNIAHTRIRALTATVGQEQKSVIFSE